MLSKTNGSQWRLVPVLTVVLLLCTLHATEMEIGQADTGTVMTQNEEVEFWDNEIRKFRARTLQPALNAVQRKSEELSKAKQNRKTPSATIKALDEDYQQSIKALALVKEQEDAMLAKIKPLYGVLSVQFAQDQKEHFASSITFVKDTSFNSAIWDSIFNLGEAESFSDIITGFLAQWLATFILMYPFAVLYYAFWTLPWSIYAYSSGFTSLVPAVVAYVFAMLVFASPLIVLGVSAFFVRRRVIFQTARQTRRHYD